MKYETYYHNHADSIIETKYEFASGFADIQDVIASMHDERLIATHNIVRQNRKGAKSLSEAINTILKEPCLKKKLEQ